MLPNRVFYFVGLLCLSIIFSLLLPQQEIKANETRHLPSYWRQEIVPLKGVFFVAFGGITVHNNKLAWAKSFYDCPGVSDEIEGKRIPFETTCFYDLITERADRHDVGPSTSLQLGNTWIAYSHLFENQSDPNCLWSSELTANTHFGGKRILLAYFPCMIVPIRLNDHTVVYNEEGGGILKAYNLENNKTSIVVNDPEVSIFGSYDITDGTVIWSHPPTANYQRGIWGFDLATQTEFMIDPIPGTDIRADQGIAIWRSLNEVTYQYDTIYRYDIANRTRYTVTEQIENYVIGQLDFSGEWMVVQDTRFDDPKTIYVTESDIFALNIYTGEEVRVSEETVSDPNFELGPAIHGNFIVWQENGNGKAVRIMDSLQFLPVLSN